MTTTMKVQVFNCRCSNWCIKNVMAVQQTKFISPTDLTIWKVGTTQFVRILTEVIVIDK